MSGVRICVYQQHWLAPLWSTPHSSITAATAWACVGTGPTTVEPWGLLMLAFPCRKQRLLSLRLSLQRPKTSAACLCWSGDEHFNVNGSKPVPYPSCSISSRRHITNTVLIVCAERADVLWLPPSVSSDTWPCIASFSSAPSLSSTQWVKALWQTHSQCCAGS